MDMTNPMAALWQNERTEPFSRRLATWAKGIENDTVVPFHGMDDHVWYAKKFDDHTVVIHRTLWVWEGIESAVENFTKNFQHRESSHVCNVKI